MTKASNPQNFLIVPGLDDSDASHWQSRWQRRFNLPRVLQPDWHTPDIDLWSQTLEHAVRELPAPVVILAHSFGCRATVFAAAEVERQNRGGIAGSAGRSRQVRSPATNHEQCVAVSLDRRREPQRFLVDDR